MNNTTRLATIDRLLSGIPTFTCREGCADCCGPVIMTRLEAKRICERIGQSETQLAKAMMTAMDKATDPSEVVALGGNCPLLKDGRCSVYDIRPAICHVFGASEHKRLTCPHGCRPESLMSVQQTNEIVDRVQDLGHGYR